MKNLFLNKQLFFKHSIYGRKFIFTPSGIYQNPNVLLTIPAQNITFLADILVI